jgi:uroporphyrinogen-III synthase
MSTRPTSPAEWAGEELEMNLLTKTVMRLSEAAPLHEVLSEVVRFMTSLVNCDSCLIYILENDELVLRGSKNPHLEVVGQLKMKMGQGVTGWVARHLKPVAITERAFEDFRFAMFHELPEDNFEAFLSVPIMSGRKLLGVINMQNRAPHQYTQAEISLAATIGFLVGAEIERSRLETHNSALIEKLETRNLVDRAKEILQRELNIREVDAHRKMQRESQNRNKTMREIAQAVILIDDLKKPIGAGRTESSDRVRFAKASGS